MDGKAKNIVNIRKYWVNISLYKYQLRKTFKNTIKYVYRINYGNSIVKTDKIIAFKNDPIEVKPNQNNPTISKVEIRRIITKSFIFRSLTVKNALKFKEMFENIANISQKKRCKVCKIVDM